MATPSLPATMRTGTSSASLEMKPEDFAKLQRLPGNMECVNCGNPKPDWGCTKLGVLFCFQCSGWHRGLGVHLSFVRSVTLDSWQPAQLQAMFHGGNQQCLDFLKRHGIADKVLQKAPKGQAQRAQLLAKYDTAAAELYRQVLAARVQGQPEPTELPQDYQPEPPQSSNHKKPTVRVDPSRLQGFGSSPPPSNNNDHDWILKALLIAGVAVLLLMGAWHWASVFLS